MEPLYSIRDTLGTASSVLIKGVILISGFMYIAGGMYCILIKRDVPFFFYVPCILCHEKKFLNGNPEGVPGTKVVQYCHSYERHNDQNSPKEE